MFYVCFICSCLDLFQQCVDLVLGTLRDADLNPSQVRERSVTGGAAAAAGAAALSAGALCRAGAAPVPTLV
jgi:hypothetical protein